MRLQSIAFWIVVYVPQIAEIIYLQSGEGLSVLFLCIVSNSFEQMQFTELPLTRDL
jgi:hypothetical protein